MTDINAVDPAVSRQAGDIRADASAQATAEDPNGPAARPGANRDGRSFAKRAGRLALGAALFLGLGYATLVGIFYVFQRDFVFYAGDAARAEVPRDQLPQAEEIKLHTADGETLIAWVVPPRPGSLVVLYFHGASDNLGQARRVKRMSELVSDGTGLVALSYRGYGGSSGSPSEQGFKDDALLAYRYAAERFGRDRIVIFGESIGTAVAIWLATQVEARALVLEAPMKSISGLVERAVPWLPTGLLLHDTFHSDQIISEVNVPTLVLHGKRDRTVPFSDGVMLAEHVHTGTPSLLVRFPSGGHKNLVDLGIVPEIHHFLAAVAMNQTPETGSRDAQERK